jgi:hypothetical protein
MRLNTLSGIVLGAALACSTTGAGLSAAEKYGDGVSPGQTTPLARVIERPADFEGKTIKVEGVVTAVCTHMGCWMALAPAGTSTAASNAPTMMIKVDDGVIVFPVTAKGRHATAQGVVERVGATGESKEAADEHARHTGAKTDAPTAWQLKATGAVVD